MTGDHEGVYYPLTGMSKEVQQQLIDDHFLFKVKYINFYYYNRASEALENLNLHIEMKKIQIHQDFLEPDKQTNTHRQRL